MLHVPSAIKGHERGGGFRLKKLIFLGMVMEDSGVSACEKEGPAEKAGAKIDEAIEEAGERLEKTGNQIDEKTN